MGSQIGMLGGAAAQQDKSCLCFNGGAAMLVIIGQHILIFLNKPTDAL